MHQRSGCKQREREREVEREREKQTDGLTDGQREAHPVAVLDDCTAGDVEVKIRVVGVVNAELLARERECAVDTAINQQ